jgi:hypothetical protein
MNNINETSSSLYQHLVQRNNLRPSDAKQLSKVLLLLNKQQQQDDDLLTTISQHDLQFFQKQCGHYVIGKVLQYETWRALKTYRPITSVVSAASSSNNNNNHDALRKSRLPDTHYVAADILAIHDYTSARLALDNLSNFITEIDSKYGVQSCRPPLYKRDWNMEHDWLKAAHLAVPLQELASLGVTEEVFVTIAETWAKNDALVAASWCRASALFCYQYHGYHDDKNRKPHPRWGSVLMDMLRQYYKSNASVISEACYAAWQFRGRVNATSRHYVVATAADNELVREILDIYAADITILPFAVRIYELSYFHGTSEYDSDEENEETAGILIHILRRHLHCAVVVCAVCEVLAAFIIEASCSEQDVFATADDGFGNVLLVQALDIYMEQADEAMLECICGTIEQLLAIENWEYENPNKKLLLDANAIPALCRVMKLFPSVKAQVEGALAYLLAGNGRHADTVKMIANELDMSCKEVLESLIDNDSWVEELEKEVADL